MSFELAQKVADAVLYEGYVLYPYRASAIKNRLRWQFGVVVPRGYAEKGGSEPWAMQTECLVEPGAATALDVRVRFLQVQARTVEEAVAGGGFQPVESLEVEGERLVTWEEGVERRIDRTGLSLAELLGGEIELKVPGGRDVEMVRAASGEVRGRIVRERWPISGVVRLAAESVGDLVKVRVLVENLGDLTDEETAERGLALRRSAVGVHTLLALRGGAFVSLLDPPPAFASAAAACANRHTWPVLIGREGERQVMLSSPIILYDYPAVAPESPGDLCDSTEIDEILTLRVMTLTEEEKREARATDPRARRIVERSDAMSAEGLGSLHGAVRPLAGPALLEEGGTTSAWESFLNPPGEAPPEEAWLDVGDVRVARGTRVRLRPSRRADSMDMFLAGRTARVEAVYRDLEGLAYLAVSLDDDPSGELLGDSLGGFGRFFYFYPEEIEPLPRAAGRPHDEDLHDEQRRPHATSGGGGGNADRGGPDAEIAAGAQALPEDQEDVADPAPEAGSGPAGRRVLIAGVGNIFLGDDGFGVEVARRLAGQALPGGVRVADFGIRGVHLAYELLDGGYDSTILVDSTPRGGEPGTVYLIEPDFQQAGDGGELPDAHSMDPRAVFRLLERLGGTPKEVRIVGCEPAEVREEIGLSEPVAAAVDEAVRLILDMLERGEATPGERT